MEMKSKNVLVTGADGFIGSHLVEMLARRCRYVKALTYYNSFNNWGWLEGSDILKDIEVFSGDIRDPYYCKKITKGIDVVFHLAALIAIPYSYLSPQSYVDTNIRGTLNICQAALDNNCERVIHTSTSEVYGTAQYVPIKETHPLQPQSPYSASKIGADSIAMSFYSAFSLPVIIARPFNTYGPRQSARATIPTIITQIASGAEIVMLGNLTPTRDFTYVYDTCFCLSSLATTDKAVGEVVNIGSNYEVSIKDLFDLIKKLMKSNVVCTADEQRVRPKSSEVFRLWCDNSKLVSLINYKPQYTLECGLVETINWFTKSENLSKYKAMIYNV